MKCPACFNELSQLQVGKLTVDVCHGGCGGIWFVAFELQRVDPTRKRECPRCEGIKLQRHFFSAKRRVEVDQCPNCGGYWLDAGELALVREEKAEATTTAAARQSVISAETIRYLYRLQTQSRGGRE